MPSEFSFTKQSLFRFETQRLDFFAYQSLSVKLFIVLLYLLIQTQHPHSMYLYSMAFHDVLKEKPFNSKQSLHLMEMQDFFYVTKKNFVKYVFTRHHFGRSHVVVSCITFLIRISSRLLLLFWINNKIV